MVAPLVSIVITSFNYGQYISDAIRSALGQTYENLEVLVLDNASTDNSLEVIKSFSDDRLRVIARPSNIGIQRNHNEGIGEAKGDFILFLSADDVLLPNLVQDVMLFRQGNPDVDIVYTSAIIADGDTKILQYFDHDSFDGCDSYRGRNELASLLTRDNCMYLPTILFPRTIFDELGRFDESLEIVLDYEFVVRMAAAGKRFAFFSKPGALIRFHGENRSGVKNFVATGKQLREFSTILERYTSPQHHEDLAGWRPWLERMIDRKVDEIRVPFPHEYETLRSEVEPLVQRARASISNVPDIGSAVFRGEGLISVIVPFSGRVGPLQRALESLKAQDYDRWEAIVLSDDIDPSDIIAFLGLKDKVRVNRVRGKRGIAVARNIGLWQAKGEIVTYLDDDNRFLPGYLSAIASAYRDSSVNATVGRSCISAVTQNGDAVFTDSLPEASSVMSLVSNRVPLNSVAHRRYCVGQSSYFHPQMNLLEDWEFLIRLARAFPLTRLSADAAELCFVVGLRSHHVFGRTTQAQWNEFSMRLEEIYKAYPVPTQQLLDERAAYAASLSALVQRGLGATNEPREMIRFVLGLNGVASVGAATA